MNKLKYFPAAICISFCTLFSCSGKNNNDKTKDRISPATAATLKEAMVKDLAGSEISKTNDIQRYCNCVVDSLQLSFTTAEIMDAEFTDSRKYRKVQDTCLKSTRIK